MLGKISGWDDTIIALATPPGVGAIGVIRISGKQAFAITNQLFPSRDLEKQPTHTIHVGFLKEEDAIIDEVVVSLFKGPSSYTGEDVIELGCHGSRYILNKVINAYTQRGARIAKPGEFTQRAFLNGKMDLAQAEAVVDLIASNTEASLKTALHTIRGGFSTILGSLREQLLQFSALIELELDFAQEDVEFADRPALYALVNQSLVVTQNLVQSFRLGNVIKNGVSIAIIGKPNAGKSTLLNALLQEERAIVSEIPGTTRDTIEEIINIDGILFRLIDTAGIREHTSDLIEKEGVGKSIAKMKQADMIIYLFDAQEDKEEIRKIAADLDQQQIKYLLVANKIDQAGEQVTREKFSDWAGMIFISARNRDHLEVLKERMVDQVMEGSLRAEDTIVTNARHYHALKEVASSLEQIREGLDNRITGDLLSLDIRKCLHYLGEITGEITNEDQLDYIFSKFCIGK
ncbi:MAG: tRNA uridine-5-carboxymethylaminomethyl(34) synthesis GTPase MnmE [Terrimonas sp.]|nr:tRNA uridine-5-carboxymethylaminomethyl(34) synthesis GTPase MnmE [Terrimonas sp.]